VKVKPVAMQTLIRIGAISPGMMAAISGDSEDPQTNFEVMAVLATYALVEPKATLDPKKVNHAKGVYSVDAIADGDLTAIFAWTQGGADVEAFREDQPGAGTGPDSALLGDDA
jgi:hypothetical protein